MTRNNNTDPRVADAESRLILAENSLDEIASDAALYALSLPSLSAAALTYAIVGTPYPAELPAYEADDFDRRFIRRAEGCRRTILRCEEIIAGAKKR